MGWIVGYEEGRGVEGKREDGRERVALSELRIIITVVVGAMRRHRGCEGYTVMGQEERRHTGAGTEDGPRWKSAAFGGTGQENWLTTFRTGSELPNRSPIPSKVATRKWRKSDNQQAKLQEDILNFENEFILAQLLFHDRV
ncbi:hypothetical protein ALC57_06868 [Trachymyrmex cornetzi]|uniref:Uncharacterized protein n=1 Tax=Trachymyrmex cornetzi TaxID=471704 RepID=A0A195E788_9HYME|nr:hypothetical protein ALC57_06868 [Trachymyrmex cornetzi]